MINESPLHPSPEDVWIIICKNCGWHSNICASTLENICPNCKSLSVLTKVVGTSQEIGHYFKTIIFNRG